MTSRVTVIVPCYNVERAIARCCASLARQTYPADYYSCLFIDDASTDATSHILASFDSVPNFERIRHATNRGLAATRNTGIRRAKGEFILFLDGDMEVPEDWIHNLVAAFDDPNVVGVMGDNELPPGQKPSPFDRYYYSRYRGARQFPPHTPLGFQWFLFGNSAMKKVVLDQVGMFDESMKMYGGEDTDLAIRVYKHYPNGLRFIPNATTRHYHPRTIPAFCESMSLYGYHNLPILLKKHPDFARELGAAWIGTMRGRLIFNPLIRFLVRILHQRYPHPLLTQYQVIDATFSGALAFYRSQRQG